MQLTVKLLLSLKKKNEKENSIYSTGLMKEFKGFNTGKLHYNDNVFCLLLLLLKVKYLKLNIGQN